MLARLGLVTAFGHVSARAGDSMLITPAADLAGVTAASVIEVPLAARALPAGAPAEAWAHLALYRARPDAAAIARAQPAAAFAVAAVTTVMVPGARAGRVAGRIGAGVRRRRAAQVRRSGRTGGILPPGRRGAAAARQRGPHPGRHSRARGGQDVAARGRLRRLPGGAGRVQGRIRSQPGHHAVGRRDRVMARRRRRAAPPPLGAPAERAGLGRTGVCRAGAGRRTGPGPARRPSATTSSTGYATGPARRT